MGRKLHGERRHPAAAGFTLLEVIVASTILSLMAVMVFSCLRFAINSYQLGQERIDAAASQRVLLDHARRQLGSLFPLRPTATFAETSLTVGGVPDPAAAVVPFPLFWGQPDTMTFISVVPLILQESPGLTIVRYGLAEDEFGQQYLGAMESRFSGLESFFMMAASPPGKPLPFVEDITDLSFEYYGFDPTTQTFEWFSAWDGQQMQSVPETVRIRFDESELVVQLHADAGAGTPQPGIHNIFQRNQ